MKVTLIFILTFSCLFFIAPKYVSADLINPRYDKEICSFNEKQVECTYISTEPFGPKVYNGCEKYENHPNYRLLVGEGHSFGGKMKYCFKPETISDLLNYHMKIFFPLLAITFILEIPIFLALLGRNRKVFTTTIFMNIISLSLLYLFTVMIPSKGFIQIILMELTVVVFETIFIKSFLKKVHLKKIMIYSIIANTASALLGSLFLIWTFSLVLYIFSSLSDYAHQFMIMKQKLE